MIAILEGVQDATTLFHIIHEFKHRDYQVYFSPLTHFASLYGKYECKDKDWHDPYLVVTPPLGMPWNIHDILFYKAPSREKPLHYFPTLVQWEEDVLSSLMAQYPFDHTMLRHLVESEEALSFFSLKPSVPWVSLMGKYSLFGFFFSIFFFVFTRSLFWSFCSYGYS